MSRLLRYLPLLLLAAVLAAPPAEAQRSWPNDNSGIPAPPCTIYDPVANVVSFCSTTTPIPVSSGGGAGTGTSPTQSVTGFGKQWYPSNFVPTGNFVVQFVDAGTTVAAFNRTVACGNCLTVSISTDGGVTYQSFNTSFIAGNDVQTMVKVPSATPRYLGYTSNGAGSHIYSSTALLSGWADSTYGGAQIQAGAFSFASNTTGAVVLSAAGAAGAVEVCKSTNQGQTFPTCITFSTSNPGTGPGGGASGAITFAGGTSWLVIDAGHRVWKSTNDGASFSQVATLTPGASAAQSILCLQPAFTACVAHDAGAIWESPDNGLTWINTLNIGGQSGNLCDYGSGNVGVFTAPPPVGLATITQTAWTSPNSGLSWFPGSVNGSTFAGAGAQSITGLSCNTSGRGAASIHSTAGTPNFVFYSPLTQPGANNFSTAGGYVVAALIQSGILQNATQTSAATTAQTITLTGTSGSRVCIRRITLFSSTASQNVTLVVQDATVTTLNFGTVSTSATAGNPLDFPGQPLFCGQTGNSVQVVVGAAAAGTTTLSVVADRYPN